MAIRYEYGPPPSALGALAYQSGVQQAQDRRRRELEALQVQAAQMRQQRQQAGLDRQFNAWKTQYGHNSAMTRMKADYQYRGNEQDKNFTNSVKMNRVQEEARQRAARDAQIAALDKQAKQAELMNDNATATSVRSLRNHYMDEQLEGLNPGGDAQAMKLYGSHHDRVQSGKIRGEAIEKDWAQTIDQIAKLHDDQRYRSRKGQPGYSKAFQGDDGIWQREFTDKNGDTQTSPAAHPTKGWPGTLDQLRLQFREDENEPYFDRATGLRVRDVRTATLKKEKDGGYYIEIEVQTGVPAPTAHEKRRAKNAKIDAAFKGETRIDNVESGRFEDEEGEGGEQVPIMEDRTIVRGVTKRRDLIAKYGPPREERMRMLPDGTIVPNDLLFEEGSKEYDEQLIEYLRRDIKEEFDLDQDDDIDLGVEEEVPVQQPKRGAPVRKPAPGPAGPAAAPAPEPAAPAAGPGMGPEVVEQPAGQENQLVKQAVEPEQQVEQNLATLQKAGWSNPTVTAVQQVRKRLLENPQEFPPEKVREIKMRMAARTWAVRWAMKVGVEPIAPVNQDPARIEQEIERLINPALPGLGGGPLRGQ